MMNVNEIRNTIKDELAREFIDAFENARASKADSYTFVLPVVVGDETFYGKFALTACQWYDTKRSKAFDYENDTEDAVEALNTLVRVREAKAAEAAAKSAERKADRKATEEEA